MYERLILLNARKYPENIHFSFLKIRQIKESKDVAERILYTLACKRFYELHYYIIIIRL